MNWLSTCRPFSMLYMLVFLGTPIGTLCLGRADEYCTTEIPFPSEECGEMPKFCAQQPALPNVTGWITDPTDSCKEIPTFNYQCDTSNGPVEGVFNESQSRPDQCVDATSQDGTHGNWEIAPNEVECWRVRTCKLSGTPVAEEAPESQWLNKRWKTGEESCSMTGSPGKVKTYLAYCDEGIDPEGTPHTVLHQRCIGECITGGGSSGAE